MEMTIFVDYLNIFCSGKRRYKGIQVDEKETERIIDGIPAI